MVTSTKARLLAAALVRPDDPAYVDALVFLMTEAEVLDAGDFEAWLGMLAPDVTYQVPVQTTRLREDAAMTSPRSFHVREDRSSLGFRVKRIVESNSAWAYNPASRTRRFVTNVRVRRAEGTDLNVSSYLLLMRSRQDVDSFDFISAERQDLLERTGEGDLGLRTRDITLDQARLAISPLPFPL